MRPLLFEQTVLLAPDPRPQRALPRGAGPSPRASPFQKACSRWPIQPASQQTPPRSPPAAPRRFCADAELALDYKRPDILRDFITERGKIVARRITGTCAKHQRALTTEIKRARQMALLFYTSAHSSDVKKKTNI